MSTLQDMKIVLENAITFQSLLEQHRLSAGLSYDQLAERAGGGVDKSYIFYLEKGTKNKPSRDVVIKIGIALGLDVQGIDELVTSAGHLPLIRLRRNKSD